jgi:hypothetical protein
MKYNIMYYNMTRAREVIKIPAVEKFTTPGDIVIVLRENIVLGV